MFFDLTHKLWEFKQDSVFQITDLLGNIVTAIAVNKRENKIQIYN